MTLGRENYIAQIEDFYQNAPCGYLTMRADGVIEGINDTLLSWIGAERGEIEGVTVFTKLLGAGSRIYFETHVRPLVEMQGFVSEINLEFKRQNGQGLPVLVTANSSKDTAEDQKLYRLTVIDYTQRKLYEAELMAARKKAEESTARLEAINKELERFAHTASHDLKAPLSTITSLIQLIEMRGYIDSEPKAAEMFEMIVRNTRRMKSMINDLLAYQHIDAPAVEFEEVSLSDACREAMDGLSAEIEEAVAMVEIGELPTVPGTEIQLVRLFQNLFSNAIKYRSENPPHIKVAAKTEGGKTLVTVADNGKGFDRENAEKIFGFMERLQSRDEIEGTGIGLSSCRRIAELHGGRIWADSEPGKGTVFFIELPAG